MNYQFVKQSSNKKIGAMPCTNSHRNTCPPSCPLIENGCYAHAGFHTRLNWDKLTRGERGDTWTALMNSISALPVNTLWRHNVSGDLPGDRDTISKSAVNDLVDANQGKRGFTYTHYPMDRHNSALIRKANKNGFTINASANNLNQASQYHKRGLPTVTIISENEHGAEWRKIERGDMSVIQCPAEYKKTDCKACKLCSHATRKTVVGFTVHGSQKQRAENVIASSAA